MSEHKRIGRNMGRVELLAVMEQIKALLAAGYDRKKIHSRLMEEGRVTMSYPTFCYQFKQQLGTASVMENPLQRPQTSSAPKLGRAEKSAPFAIDHSLTLKDLV
jgi:hypothetical protein